MKKELVKDGRTVKAKKKAIGKRQEGGGKKKSKKKRNRAREEATKVAALNVRRVAVSDLRPAAYNPRKDLKPGDPEYEKLKRSIEEFGCVDPPVWNERSGNLVGGHQRLKVLVDVLGVTEVDVSVVDLPPAKEKALNVALNKIAGDWDPLALAELMAELTGAAAIDETVTGFDEVEIAALVAEVENGGGEDEVPGSQINVGHSYKVIVNCRDAKEQDSVVALLGKKGLACHTRTSE